MAKVRPKAKALMMKEFDEFVSPLFLAFEGGVLT